ncbi:MAG: hypothetical protein J6Y94_06945, partial [Bacteriovoracaceae bacterium]|nr:hypothetical protein [Bacteriovoracaceae bacterium]
MASDPAKTPVAIELDLPTEGKGGEQEIAFGATDTSAAAGGSASSSATPSSSSSASTKVDATKPTAQVSLDLETTQAAVAASDKADQKVAAATAKTAGSDADATDKTVLPAQELEKLLGHKKALPSMPSSLTGILKNPLANTLSGKKPKEGTRLHITAPFNKMGKQYNPASVGRPTAARPTAGKAPLNVKKAALMARREQYLQEHIYSLSAQQKKTAAALDQLQAKKVLAEKEHQKVLSEYHRLKEKNKDLTTGLKEQELQKEELNTQLERMRMALSDGAENRQKLEHACYDAELQLKQMQAEVKLISEHRNNAEKQLQQVKGEVQEAEGRIENAKNELAEIA